MGPLNDRNGPLAHVFLWLNPGRPFLFRRDGGPICAVHLDRITDRVGISFVHTVSIIASISMTSFFLSPTPIIMPTGFPALKDHTPVLSYRINTFFSRVLAVMPSEVGGKMQIVFASKY